MGPVLSALLLTLSLPPYPLPLLAPVALAPVAFHLERLPDTSAGTRGAALAGMVVGGLHAVLLLHWLPGAAGPLLGPVRGVAGALAVWGLNAALVGVALVLVHRGMVRRRLALPLGLAAAWTALGWGPATLPVVGFPWLGPEAALVGRPELLGAADLVGGAGVAGLLALSGGVLGQWLARRRGSSRAGDGTLGWLVLAGVLLGTSAIYGHYRAGQLSPAEGEGIRVAALSLDADPRLLVDRDARERRLTAGLHRLSRELLPGEAELILWPESPTGTWDRPMEPFLATHWSRRSGAPILFGVVAALPDQGRSNRILLASGEWDRPEGKADLRVVREKRRLVPVVEQSYARGLRSMVLDGPVEGPFVLPSPGEAELQAGALICFEALFAAEALRLRRRGARILVFPANEGWLTGAGSGMLDSARRQHQAALVLRVVATRTGGVRSAVGGPAGAWSAVGRALPGQVRTVDGVGYMYLGDVPPGPERTSLAARGGAAAAGLAGLLLLVGGAILPPRNRGPRSRVY